MAAKNKGGLGRGLDALFIDNSIEDNGSAVTLRLSEIEPNRDQPRKSFDESALSELADSIREHGVLQPLIVRPIKDGGYQLIAGERRFRASRMAGLSEVPVIIRELTDSEAMEIALIENLQRQDLNPLEEALGYAALMEEFSFTQDEVAKRVGKSRSAVANSLRLLGLPNGVADMLKNGDISGGHARALLAIEDEALCLAVARQIAEKGLSVRDAERMARESKKESSVKKVETAPAESFYREVELALTEALGRRVKVSVKKGEMGELTLDFISKEDLKDIAAKLAD